MSSKTSDPLELEVSMVVVSYQIRALRMEPRSLEEQQMCLHFATPPY